MIPADEAAATLSDSLEFSELPESSEFSKLALTRRRLLACASAAGLGGTLFPGALLALAARETQAQAQGQRGAAEANAEKFPDITSEMIEHAAALAGLSFTEEQRRMMLDTLKEQRQSIVQVRRIPLPNAVAPSLVQDPVLPGTTLNTQRLPPRLGPAPSTASLAASNEEQIAFATIRQLGELLRARKITSLDLTRLYLARLKRYDPTLHFLITATDQRALDQAAAADKALAARKPLGPLHGIPWGAKDLLAVKGYPTTWGAGPIWNRPSITTPRW